MTAERELQRDTGDNPVETGEKRDKTGDKTEPLAEKEKDNMENLREKRITKTKKTHRPGDSRLSAPPRGTEQ